MWISFRNVADLFSVSKDTVVALREEVAALKAENAAAKSELLSTKINLDWLRVQYNQVQAERTALMNKTFGTAVPTPQLQSNPGSYFPTAATQDAVMSQVPSLNDLTFDDIGDELASRLGFPVYGK